MLLLSVPGGSAHQLAAGLGQGRGVGVQAVGRQHLPRRDVEPSGDGNAWLPSVMNDVVFNDVFAVRIGTDGDLKDATPGDDVIVEGGRTEDGSYSMALWENWREIDLGTFDLAAGDNIVELENVNSTLTNLAGEIFGFNVDKLVVEFV